LGGGKKGKCIQAFLVVKKKRKKGEGEKKKPPYHYPWNYPNAKRGGEKRKCRFCNQPWRVEKGRTGGGKKRGSPLPKHRVGKEKTKIKILSGPLVLKRRGGKGGS